MLAHLQRLTTFALLATALAWAALALHWGRPGWAAAGAALILCGYALFLAFEFLWTWRCNLSDSVPRARAVEWLSAWWGEVRAAPAVFCWRQPFRSQRWPDHLPVEARGRLGVLYIHGFVCNRGLWNRWLAKMHAADVPFVAVNLEPVFGGIENYAGVIEEAVQRIERCTGRAPVVVAHSMGGLALRCWWAAPGNAGRVHRALTIGTPHAGTALARFAFSTNGRQMRRDSAWLQALQAREPEGRPSCCTCFYGHADNIVFPASTAAWPGAEHRHLRATAHVAMVDHPAPMLALQQLLSADREGAPAQAA